MGTQDRYGIGLVEVVYESEDGRDVGLESEPESGFPTTVMHEGHLFLFVARDIVSRSGESTHDRVRYRQQRSTMP